MNNHPNREEWMSYLYGEAPAEQRAALSEHLRACRQCRAQVNTWRTAGADLDHWQLPARRRPSIATPLFRWAAAALLIISLGFGVGRMTAPRPDVEQIRSAVEPAIRDQLRQEFTTLLQEELARISASTLNTVGAQSRVLWADFAEQFEAQRAADTEILLYALERLEERQFTDYLSLRTDLDIVTLFTDASLRATREDLLQLAEYAQPRSNPETSSQ